MAANFKTTLDKLVDAFEAETDHNIDVVVGSTGKLYAQIVYGAPYDIFLSADQTRPARLVDEQHAISDSRFTYALGRLVLLGVDSAEALRAVEIKRVALANPNLAPYGKASEQVLIALGLFETLQPQLVLGENVGQAFAFVQTGNAQAGFVSEAQVLESDGIRNSPLWRPNQDLHDPIAQDAVLLERAADNEAAIAFLEFLKSAEAKDIIAQSGYDRP